MILLPFRRNRPDPTIEALYGMIVAQARSPSFYRDHAVPDSVEGRLDMIMLHLVLVLRRLREDAESGRLSGQRLFDRFCRDMDDNFREMGVGDLAVPRKMRHVAEAFYGRSNAYEAALEVGDAAALEAALFRNVFGGSAALGARRLAAYMMAAAGSLAATDIGTGAALDFPDPERIGDSPQEAQNHDRSPAG